MSSLLSKGAANQKRLGNTALICQKKVFLTQFLPTRKCFFAGGAKVKCLELTGDTFTDDREMSTLEAKLRDHNLIMVKPVVKSISYAIITLWVKSPVRVHIHINILYGRPHNP